MDTNTRRDYFDAGLDLLSEAGPRGVTVAALCGRLGVTKGSFYHHFDGIPGFLRGLLAHWESEEMQRMVEAQAGAAPDRRTEIAKLAAAWGIRHESESAIRALARTDPAAAAVQQRVDEWREDNLFQLFCRLGIEPGRARTLGRLGMAIMVGTQQMEHPVDRKRLEETLGEYQRWVEEAAAEARRSRPRLPTRTGGPGS